MKKIYNYVVFDTKNNYFCFRQTNLKKLLEAEEQGFTVIDYGKQDFTASDVDLYTAKGFKFDTCGAFIE